MQNTGNKTAGLIRKGLGKDNIEDCCRCSNPLSIKAYRQNYTNNFWNLQFLFVQNAIYFIFEKDKVMKSTDKNVFCDIYSYEFEFICYFTNLKNHFCTNKK